MIPAQVGSPGVLTLEFDPLPSGLRLRLRDLVSAHRLGPSALGEGDASAETPLEPQPAARPGPAAVAEGMAAQPIEAAADGPALEVDPQPPAPPRRLVPLCDEASRVVLARSLSREGMRAEPSPRLVRSAEITLALHLEADGPPLRVHAHVEPGEAGAGPWLRFKDLAPDECERLDRLLTGLWGLAAGDGPEHPLVVCEILDPSHG
jgi:hypothetical protein